MPIPRRSTTRWRCCTALLMAFFLGACGSRLSIDEIRRDAVAVGVPAAPGAQGGSGEQGLGLATGTATVSPGANQGPGGTPITGPGGGTSVSGSGSGGSSGISSGNKSPIILGSVSTLSGPSGSAQLPSVRAYQAWVRMINDSGGINGHPIKFYVADDSSDPTRHGALVRDMVENKHVIAFFNFASQSDQGASDYLLQHRVPVVGGDSSIDIWWNNPMYFPELGDIRFVAEGLLRMAARFPKTPGKNLGILVCREAAICSDAASELRSAAAKLG